MALISIIIPSRNEFHKADTDKETTLQRTVRDIYEKATGDFEVLVAFDGPPYQDFPDYKNFTAVKNKEARGLKPCVNQLVDIAKGKYIYKTDAHCSFGKGFDEILQADMEDNWIVMPRFYVLNPDTWEWQDERFYDYFFLCCPLTDRRGFRFQAGGHWKNRTHARVESHPHMDEIMQMHGSGWMITKDFFQNCLKGMQSKGYGVSYMEPPELCLKTWLGPWGGKCMVNKKAWYAHMHKGNRGRGKTWELGGAEVQRSYLWTAEHWMTDSEPNMKYKLEWLVERFMPIPGWPEDYKELWDKWKKDNNK